MIETLQAQHSIKDTLDFTTGNGGLIKAVIATPHATGEIYLNGAHVTHYQPTNQPPVLFMSNSSRFEPGKAIRGGIPICFPWFGSLEGRDTGTRPRICQNFPMGCEINPTQPNRFRHDYTGTPRRRKAR